MKVVISSGIHEPVWWKCRRHSVSDTGGRAGADLSCPLTSPPTRAELSVVFSRTVAGFQSIQIMGPLVLLFRQTSHCWQSHYSFNDFMSSALFWQSAEGFRAPKWLMDPVKMTLSGWSDPDCSKLWILGELKFETIKFKLKYYFRSAFTRETVGYLPGSVQADSDNVVPEENAIFLVDDGTDETLCRGNVSDLLQYTLWNVKQKYV